MMWGPGGGWIAGLVLIGLGILFLLRNFGVPMPDNWWAIFLIAAGGSGRCGPPGACTSAMAS